MRNFSDEDKEIAEHVLCKICKQFLIQPIQLPCSENVCGSHLNKFIKVDDQENAKKYFDCVCREKHFIEKDPEFSLSKSLSYFCERYRNENCDFAGFFKKCKESFENLNSEDKIPKLKDFLTELQNYFDSLRSIVDSRRGDVILEINKASDELLDEINKLEREYFNKLENIYSGFDLDQFKDQVKEYEVKLNEHKIDLDEWAKINEKIKQDLSRLNQIKENSKSLVSSKEKIKFKEGSLDFDFKNLIGQITINTPKRLISGSYDNSIKIWNLGTLECIQTIEHAHNGYVLCLELLDDKIASGSYDNTIKIWDLENFELLKTLNGHLSSIYCIRKINENEIMSGSKDKTIKIWDLNSGDCIKTLEGHTKLIKCLEITNDKKLILSCSYDKTIKIWNYETGECLRTLTGHSNYVLSLALMDNIVISGSLREIKIWDVSSGDCLKTLTDCHNHWVRCIRPYKQNQFMSGSDDGFIKLWDIQSGECEVKSEIKAHDGWIWALEKYEDGQILSGSGDYSIKFWNLDNGNNCIKMFSEHSNSVSSLIIKS